MIHIALIHPEIHWNTGNAGRSCLAAGAQLHLIEPLGFDLSERAVKRAGLDYWPHVKPQVWGSLNAFEAAIPSLGAPLFFSTKATKLYSDHEYEDDIVLIFGRETGGLPATLHERYPERFVKIPIISPLVRSLNLSTAVGIALYEAVRHHSLAR